jgi:FkbM family methyltransferase
MRHLATRCLRRDNPGSSVDSKTDRQKPHDGAQRMKLFRLPHGLRVWGAPAAGLELRYLYHEIFEQYCYERHGITVADGNVVFDVGANIGMFSLSLMDRFRDLQIYCFEPIPITYACLARNLAESSRKADHAVVTMDVAIGAADSQTTMEYFPIVPSNSTQYPSDKHRESVAQLDSGRFSDVWKLDKRLALLFLIVFPFRRQLAGPLFRLGLAGGVTITCPVKTLSGVIRERGVERIDLLKIDVEGAEMDVLAGLQENHWALVRQLAIEISPSNKSRVGELTNRLRSLGFEHIAVESMLGGASNLDDRVPCTIFAVREAA